LSEKYSFNSNNEVDTKFVNTWDKDRIVRVERYDKNNQLRSTTVKILDSIKHTELSKEIFENHEENKILIDLNTFYEPTKIYSIGGSEVRSLLSTFEYDSVQRLKINENWNYNRSRYQRVEYQYDSLNRITLGLQFNITGELIGTDSLVYDRYFNLIYNRSFAFYADEWSNESYSYKYDAFGNILLKETWLLIGENKYLISRIHRVYQYN